MENDLKNYIQEKKLLFTDEIFLQEKGKSILELLKKVLNWMKIIFLLIEKIGIFWKNVLELPMKLKERETI